MVQKVIELTIDEADILSDILYDFFTTTKKRPNIFKGNQKDPFLIDILEKEASLARDILEQLDDDADLVFKSEEYFERFKSLICTLLNMYGYMESTTEVSERLIDQERIVLRTIYTKLG